MEGKGQRFERETVITFNEAESSAAVWTASETIYRRLKNLGYVPTEDNERSAVFEVPKAVVRVLKPRVKRELTEKQREALRKGHSSPKALDIIPGKRPFLGYFTVKDGPIKTFRRSWLTACVKAGLGTEIRLANGKLIKKIGNRIPHDFRRTAVRNLERAGVSRSDAMKMVGHKTESIYRRYAIADEKSMREAAAKLDQLHALDQQPRETTK